MGILKTVFGKQQPDSDPAEFKALLESSMEGLRLQTESHQRTWGLGQSQRWDFSQDNGELVFTFPNLTVRAPAQIIGTFDIRDKSWMWAWANESLGKSLVRDSARMRDYGKTNGIARLTNSSWRGEEIDAWQMTALANRLCETNGAYRGPAGTTLVFFTFGDVQITRR